MHLEPMAAAPGSSISNTLSVNLDDTRMMPLHANSRTHEASKFATYTNTGKLQLAGAAQIVPDGSRFAQQVILQKKVSDEDGSDTTPSLKPKKAANLPRF